MFPPKNAPQAAIQEQLMQFLQTTWGWQHT
jgi:hypothetical protein